MYGTAENRKNNSNPDSTSMTIQRKAWKLCYDYLQGSWKQINPEDVVLRQISGGLTNLIYHVSLPKSLRPKPGEPKEALLRLYGQKYNENDVQTSSKVLENVIFTLLSEKNLGPKLLGVFREGRLEEFIQARSMTQEEVRDPYLSCLIAKKMSKIHRLNMPINKENQWLFSTLHKYQDQISSVTLDGVSQRHYHLAEKLLSFNFPSETEWLKKFLSKFHSPIVFCHNDIQGGNILLRRGPKFKEDEKLLLIDFEFADYNFRAFDLANHLCEYMYDYTNEDYPFYYCLRKNFPTRQRQMEFFSAYLSTDETLGVSTSGSSLGLPFQDRLRERANSAGAGPASASPPKKNPGKRVRHLSCQQQSEILFHEVQAFLLAPHLLWCMWSIIQSTNTKIPFGYWSYASDRMEDYISHKNAILAMTDPILGIGQKRTLHEN
eukprot:TCALIF_05472-PA protein Name:"Similar to Chka Choline kinase alpha (Mus musculus)" AED:0.12 eAED:0.12 QI:203/0.83/0.71/0.85/0.83/0.57/7/0/433